MADLGRAYTDKQIENLDHRIHGIYKEAEKDINRKMREFNEKYKVKEAKYAKQVADGKITQEQFDNWKKGQVFQGKQWQAKKESIQQVLHNSNVIAAQIINHEAVGVMHANLNYSAYDMEKGMGVNFGFNIYDRTTVLNLIKNEPNLLPHYVPKAGLDANWNSKKITRQITLGIIQGEKLDDIAARLAKVTASQNENSMKTHARTLMTAAQNQGRLMSYRNAKALGIDLEKEWMATLDGHTRDSHADVDGEKQPLEKKFSNDCMYPGDPGGPPAEVYNCRCTLVSDIKKYPAKYQRRDNIAGKPIDNMTYRQWAQAKAKEAAMLKVDYSKYGGKEIFDILRKYGDYDTFVDKATEEDFDLVWKDHKLKEIRSMYKSLDADLKAATSSTAPKTMVPKSTSKPASTPKPAPTPTIDYSKYGGKEAYDIFAKYGSIEDLFSSRSDYSRIGLLLQQQGISLRPADIRALWNEVQTGLVKQNATIATGVVQANAVTTGVVRAQSYINGVTDTAIKNYDLQDEINKTLEGVGKKLGLTPEETDKALSNGLKKVIDNSDFTMRIRESNLAKVLKDGRFKNQFETGSSGGAFAPDTRKKLEHKMFNVPKDSSIKDSDRPVYGMFCPQYTKKGALAKDISRYYDTGPGSWYGDGVTVVLKKENLINNATFTIGDSLDYKGSVVGMDPTNIKFGGSYVGRQWGSQKYESSELVELARLGMNNNSTAEDAQRLLIKSLCSSDDKYLEYQLHGQQAHSIDNIEKIIFTKKESRVDPALLFELDNKGIPYEFING